MPKHKPKLGQNFLVDDSARYRIADALGDIGRRTVLEIGPGKGAITEILAGRAGRLTGVREEGCRRSDLNQRGKDEFRLGSR